MYCRTESRALALPDEELNEAGLACKFMIPIALDGLWNLLKALSDVRLIVF